MRRRGPGAFSLVLLLLILSVAGAAAWLQTTYEPPPAPAAPTVHLALPEPEPEPADQQAAAEAEQPAPPTAPGQPAETPPAATAEASPPEPAAAPPIAESASPPPAPQPGAPPAPEAAPTQAASDGADQGPSLAAVPAPAEPERQAMLSPPPQPAETWRAHAQPFEGQAGLPRIAILIWDLGLSPEPTRAAIAGLPREVTLGFAPYGDDLQKWADEARAAGHEVVLQAPMEPERFPENDPGPHTLLTGLAPAENLERLDWVLGRFTGYVGVVNYMGSRFTASPDDLKPVLARLKERGLIFLDSKASSDSVADRLARELGLAHAANARYIDNEASRIAIEARLGELEKIAQERGWAVGIGYHYPVTIDRLAQWAKTLPAKGLQLAPLSAVVRQEEGGPG